MAQERTLGLATAPQSEGEELSKEEWQRRMEEARESISETVTEIKETVALQVENVKDALDWREHVRKQPVAWSLGALGVGFLTGYCIAATVKGEDDEYDNYRISPTYARPLTQSQHYETPKTESQTNGKHEGPGLIKRFQETPAYDRLSKEAATIGDRLVEELSTTAQTVVIPLLLTKLKHWIGLDLSQESGAKGSYQPVLERKT